MLKNILKLNGAQELTRNEQKSINGAAPACTVNANGSMTCYKRCPNGRWIVSTLPCPGNGGIEI